MPNVTSPTNGKGPVRAVDHRPRIFLDPDRVDVAVHQSIAMLGAAKDVYQLDRALVAVVRTTEPDARRGMVPGTPVVHPLTVATLRARLASVATYERLHKGKPVSCAPPAPIVQAVHEWGEWPAVRPLVGIVEAPTMRPDGSLVTVPGHDRATGFLYVPAADFGTIEDEPTREAARAALEELREPFADFPWHSPAAADVPVAAVLTMVARPAITGSVPAFLVDANVRGAGKSKTTDVVSTIATGRAAPRMSWPPDDAELEKCLAGYALRAASTIAFDNIDRVFGGAPLDKVLTATDRVELRVLGQSKVPSLTWRAVIFGTGNNIAIGGDTVRRVLVARMESPLERPENRTDFRHADLIAWVTRERPRLVRAALTLLRAYVVAGRPSARLRAWGSFEAWAALVPAAIAWAGGADIMECRPADDGTEDPDKAALVALLAAWNRLDDGRGVAAKDLVARAYPADLREQQQGKAPPDGFDDLRTALEGVIAVKPGQAPTPYAVGLQLRKWKGRVVGGARLVAAQDRTNVIRWRLRGAGDAGDAGDFPTTPRANAPGNCPGGEPQTSLASPASPAPRGEP